MTVAIDGPAGAGKSTVAKNIARRFGLFYLNSGNFYRAITLFVLTEGYDPSDENDVVKAAGICEISIKSGQLYLNGKNVENLLHTDRIDNWVAEHSAIIEVRKIVNEQIRRATSGMDVIAEGRDMTTVVFPSADVKFYLDASIDARVGRRDNQGTSRKNEEGIRENLEKRDHIDKNKPFGSLKIAEDAVYLDTTDLTIEAVCERVQEKIEQLREQ